MHVDLCVLTRSFFKNIFRTTPLSHRQHQEWRTESQQEGQWYVWTLIFIFFFRLCYKVQTRMYTRVGQFFQNLTLQCVVVAKCIKKTKPTIFNFFFKFFFAKILINFPTPLHSKKNKLHFCKFLKTFKN